MKGILLVLLFSSSLLFTPTSRTRKSDLSCAQHDQLKEDCGFYGITQEQCEERDCCYGQPSIDGKPWCFKGIDDIPTYYTLSSKKSCGIDRESRKECGYLGIKKDECESRDCCYKIDDYQSIIPWCFKGYEETLTTEITDLFSYEESGE